MKRRRRSSPAAESPTNRLHSMLLILLLPAALALDAEPTAPPQILPPGGGDVNPTRIWLDESQRLSLRCPLNTSGGLAPSSFKIQWSKDGERLDSERAQFLEIGSVSRADSGVYRCLVGNERGTAYSWSMNVSVLYIDGFKAEKLSVLTVTEAGNFVLRPPALLASPQLHLSWRWFYDENEITSNTDYYITLQGALVVGNPAVKAGNYSVQVRAANSPTFTHRFDVRTTGDSGPTTTEFRVLHPPLDLVHVEGRERPFSLQSADTADDQAAVFECVPAAHGKNPPSVRWRLNGDLLVAETHGIHIEQRGRRLVLMNVAQFFSEKTGGSFDRRSATVQCEAASGPQKSTASARLDVIEVPKINRKLFDGQRFIPLNSVLKLRCKAENAWPRAKFSWFFNGKKASWRTRRSHSSPRHLQIPNSISSDILKIESVQANNYGVYQCEAANSAGSDIATVWVREPRAADREGLFGPQNDEFTLPGDLVILQKPADVAVKPGADVVFHCVTNDPFNSRVSWTFNDELVARNPRVQTNRTSLTIHSVRPTDAGRYVCLATSADSEDEAEAAADLMIRGSRLIEYGPNNQSQLIGTIIRMPCKISDEVKTENPEVVPEWSKNGQKIPPTGDPSRRIAIEADGSLFISQVGPDSIGVYKCLVAVGSETEEVEASLQIIEKPSMPQNVEAELLNDTLPAKIRVTWRPGFDGNSPIIKHLVEIRTLGQSGHWSEWEKATDKLTDDSAQDACCFASIDNVRPSSTASFRVIAFNRYGAGRPSEPSGNVTMPQQPPAAAPREVRASGRSSSSIIVQWNPPPAEGWNGEILGYQVRYRLSGYDDLEWNLRNVSNPNARNTLLESLISWRDYEIQVAAYNDRGLGVYSKPIEAAPWESAPMQSPQNVQAEVLNSTDVRLSFDPLDQQMIPGVNQGYKIEFWKGAPGGTLYRLVRVNPDFAARLVHEVSGLEKFGHYNVTVLCFTNAGDGPRSDAIEMITEEDVPGPIATIDFDQILATSVVVQWEAPPEPNGVIIKYLLRHWETEHPSEKNEIMVGGTETNVTIEGLRPSTQYSIDLQAVTKEGAGPRTEAKFESGVPPELPGRPTAVVVSDIGARSAVLQFIPGFDGHSFIKNWIVEAKVGSSSLFTTIFNISAPKARSLTVERLRPHTKYQLRLIAENVRGRGAPSDPTRSFQTRETEPENAPEKVYAEPISDERIQVVWTPLLPGQWNAEPTGYLIKYRAARLTRLGSRPASGRRNDEELLGAQEEADEQDTEWKEVRTSNPKASELTLLALEPFTSYQIKVFAENTFGLSEASETVSATTYESAPSAGPQNVRVDVEQQSVRVQWDDLPSRHKRGNILGFRVRLVPEEDALRSKHTRSLDLVGADVRSAHFSKLRPFTEYRLAVLAYTLVGDGPPAFADPPVVRTPEDVPEQPSSVRFSKITPHSVNLLWEAPIEPNGRITSFGIRYWREDQSEAQAISTTVKHNLYEFSANSLTSNATYVFSVKAETAAGWGPEIEAAVFTSSARPQPPSPPTPERNAMRAPAADGVWLRWPSPPRRPTNGVQEAPVRGVEVEFHRTNEPWRAWPVTILPDKNEVFLDGLLPNQKYQARIRYVSDFDRSLWSAESAWIATSEAAPSKPPQNVEAQPYESSSILLKWTPLEPEDWNSRSVGYRVLYRIYPSNDSFMVDEVPMMESNPGGKLQHVIKKLTSFHHYLVQVQSFNSLGASPVSTPPAFVYVGFSIPKQEIRGLNATPQSSTSIHVRWEDWTPSNDDVISGYRVRFTPLLSSLSPEIRAEMEGGESTEEVVVTEKNEIVLSDLRKFTEYQILVSGYNRAGNGQAASIRAKTLEDTPGPVGALEFADILLDSVNVSWSPPAQPNGQLVGYLVTYRTYRMPEEFRKEIQEKTPVNFLVPNRLEENTTYSFSVQALTTVGAGPEVTGNVTIGWNPGAPTAPTRPQVQPEEMTVLLRWRDGSAGSTPIKGHLIQAKRVGVVNQTAQPSSPFAEDEPNAVDEANGLPSASTRTRRSFYDDPYAPRHTIGEWHTISSVMGTNNEYRVSYRQLMPASYYVFRVFSRNNLGIGMPSEESERLQVPATLPEEAFYTKWWFLVIIGLLIVMVLILFVSVLCVTSATSWKKEEKPTAYDTHQLSDGFVVSYELQSKQRGDEPNTTPRPATHTSWLSNDVLNTGRGMGLDPPYGSIGSGLNQGFVGPANMGNQSARSIYGSSSVYQQLTTDQIPPEVQRTAGGRLNGSIASGAGGYASANYAHRRPNASGSTGGTLGRDYWTSGREESDYAIHNGRSMRENGNGLADLLPPLSHNLMGDADEPSDPAEHSFASHYQSTNPTEEAYRQTWRKTREQVERSRAPSRNVGGGGYAALGPNGMPFGYPSRPESANTNESASNGSEHGGAAGSSSTQSAKSVHAAGPGIQLRRSDEFESPKHPPNAPYNGGNPVQHGFSSFV